MLLLIWTSVWGTVKTSFNCMYLLLTNFCNGLTGRKRKVCLNVAPQHSVTLLLDYSKKDIQGVSSFLTTHLNSKRLLCISIIITDKLICCRCFEESVEIVREKKHLKNHLLSYIILKLSKEGNDQNSLSFNSFLFSLSSKKQCSSDK